MATSSAAPAPSFSSEGSLAFTDQRGIPGAGTVHHIAWHSHDADHLSWQQSVRLRQPRR